MGRRASATSWNIPRPSWAISPRSTASWISPPARSGPRWGRSSTWCPITAAWSATWWTSSTACAARRWKSSGPWPLAAAYAERRRVPERGADLVVEALVAAGVRQLFSLSGNQILSLYDATIGSGIRIIHTRHEAAAVHMADAWGRLTEEPGVALVTAGPGHLNALSALYGALMSESPVVLLSGASPLGQAGRGAFQEMDQAAAAAPVTKAAWMASKAERLSEDIAIALDLAKSGRPGPVHVSLPGDLLEHEVEGSQDRLPAIHRPPIPVANADLRRLLELLEASRHPLILTGSAMSRPAPGGCGQRLPPAPGIP